MARHTHDGRHVSGARIRGEKVRVDYADGRGLVTYDSRTEAEYGQMLFLDMTGQDSLITSFAVHPKVNLVVEAWELDFRVNRRGLPPVWIDVKGAVGDERTLRHHIRLWEHFGPGELWIERKARGGRWRREVIAPHAGDDGRTCTLPLFRLRELYRAHGELLTRVNELEAAIEETH